MSPVFPCLVVKPLPLNRTLRGGPFLSPTYSRVTITKLRVMEEELAWKWDPSPAHDYRNYIRIDSFQEILAFGGRNDQDTMVVVQGSKPLAQNMYHTWTVLIQNIWNAEV
ncbi:uncharacterized protein LOC134787093, partial [Penaeus indicus]|uniref:uncharacterized protein LOC134787093 n=1 Tax=Penaeus indicus TaxID=29960 RepID=UPI00300D3125